MVVDGYSRRRVDWAIDSQQNTTLVLDALDMALKGRQPDPGGIVHADHGTQFTSWVFGEKIRKAGLMPSLAPSGDGLNNATMESFWYSIQIELLNRQRWKARIELTNALFDYIEIFHNRKRRHAQLGHLSPTDFELRSTVTPLIA